MIQISSFALGASVKLVSIFILPDQKVYVSQEVKPKNGVSKQREVAHVCYGKFSQAAFCLWDHLLLTAAARISFRELLFSTERHPKNESEELKSSLSGML